MSKYEMKKHQIRSSARDWQEYAREGLLSWDEVVFYRQHFATLARKYGLLKEFKINGII